MLMVQTDKSDKNKRRERRKIKGNKTKKETINKKTYFTQFQ